MNEHAVHSGRVLETPVSLTSTPGRSPLASRLAFLWSWILPRAGDTNFLTMAKVSIWLHWLAGLLALGLMAIPPTGPALVVRVAPLAVAAILFTVVIRQFPWHRFHRRLFLGVSLLDIGLVGVGVALTGGPTSRYQLIFVLIVVFAAYFYTIAEASFITAIAAAVYCCPLLYSPRVPSWSVPLAAGTLGVTILVAGVTKETVLRIERERELRDQAESERARLYDDEVKRRTSLQRKTRQLESILEMGNAFRLQLGLDALLEKIASAIAETVGFRAVVVRLFDPVTGEALCKAAYGVDWDIVSLPTPPELIRSLMHPKHQVSRSYLVEVQPSDLEDPAKQPYLYVLPGHRAEEEDEWKSTNSLIVPLETREHGLIGIISIDEPVDGKIPSFDTIQALEIFANLAATAIDNARLLEEASQAQALRELDRLKSEFLATVSHDLRTPLTVIKGSVDLLESQTDGLSPVQTKLISGINKNTGRLMGMVEQLLEMIQLQDGRINLNRHLVDVREVVADTADAMAVAARSRKQWIEVQPLAHPASVLIDRERIQQVLTNLVGNACKYGPENQPIELSTEPTKDGIIVRVHDHGPGIPAEEQRRIFEKFYRSENNSRRVEGAGLGLAICQSLVELHGGRIWVESRHAEGTTFAFSLPKSGSDL